MGLTQITTGGLDSDINIDSNTLKVDGTNNRVGIGAADVNAPLEVRSSSALQIRTSTGTGNYWEFGRDDSTGDFFLADDGLGTVVAVDQLTGNVGIGTALPSRLLTIQSTGNANFCIKSANTGVSQCMFGDTDSDVAGNITYRHSENAMTFEVNSSERMRIDSSGRVLIGGTSAISGSSTNDNLQLINSAGSILSIASSDTTIGNGTRIGEIEFWGQPNSTWGKFAGISAFGDGSAGGVNGNPGRLVFYTESVGSDGGPVERMRIDSSGVVQSYKFHRWMRSDGTTNCGFVGRGDQVISGGSNADLGISTGGGDLVFGAGGTAEKMRIDSSGRLLINTSTEIDTSTAAGSVHMVAAGGGKIYMMRDSSSVAAGSDLGMLRFYSNDGGEEESVRIEAEADAAHSAGDKPGRLVFRTTASGSNSPTERMRITSGGRVGVGMTSPAGQFHVQQNSGVLPGMYVDGNNGGYSATLSYLRVSRGNNLGFNFLACQSAYTGSTDNEFILRGDGNGYADDAWHGGGADYAEYFEWSDGNTEAEDRRGISVVLDGDKIREAVTGEEPIGVISGNPSVVGDADIARWKHKYLRDDFGTYVRDEEGERQLNPDYDPDTEYVSREDRPEWDTVGLMGKLRIRKGQITGSRWIKMRDVSSSVEEWLVR